MPPSADRDRLIEMALEKLGKEKRAEVIKGVEVYRLDGTGESVGLQDRVDRKASEDVRSVSGLDAYLQAERPQDDLRLG